MRNITIGFSTGKTCLAKLIRWVTKSQVSHTYIKLKTHFESPSHLIYQASGITVNVESLENFMGHATVIEELSISISDQKYDELLAFLLTKLGRPYSMWQLLGMAWVLMMRNFGITVRNPGRDGDHSFVCVELVCRALDIPNGEELTPQDLLDVLRSQQELE